MGSVCMAVDENPGRRSCSLGGAGPRSGARSSIATLTFARVGSNGNKIKAGTVPRPQCGDQRKATPTS